MSDMSCGKGHQRALQHLMKIRQQNDCLEDIKSDVRLHCQLKYRAQWEAAGGGAPRNSAFVLETPFGTDADWRPNTYISAMHPGDVTAPSEACSWECGSGVGAQAEGPSLATCHDVDPALQPRAAVSNGMQGAPALCSQPHTHMQMPQCPWCLPQRRIAALPQVHGALFNAVTAQTSSAGECDVGGDSSWAAPASRCSVPDTVGAAAVAEGAPPALPDAPTLLAEWRREAREGCAAAPAMASVGGDAGYADVWGTGRG